MPIAPIAPDGLAALEDQVRRELALLAYPERTWIPERHSKSGEPILDVLVIGGGQSGLAAAFALMREKVTRLLVVDDSPAGRAGPWKKFARMKTLRTPKHLAGPELGLPSLGVRAWYEAQFGAQAWQELVFLPKELWQEYLDWYRTLLAIPVRHETRAGAVAWRAADACFAVPLTSQGREETVLARKVVLAMGIDGSGRWDVPAKIRTLPKERWAHTSEDIDFAALKGKRVGILGAGASAFDNAAVALETGARRVDLYFRRRTLPNVNPYRWADFVGFLKHHGDLADADRWRFTRQILVMGQLPPRDTLERARAYANFGLHGGSDWSNLRVEADGVHVTAQGEDHVFDFIVVGSGFVTDLSLRPELAGLHGEIALWQDRFQPPAAESHDDLLRHPYLGPGFELQEKHPGQAPWLSGIFNYTFGCLLSLGFGGASISGMKYSIPRLVGGVTAQLYRDDAEEHFRSLAGYSQADFETLS